MNVIGSGASLARSFTKTAFGELSVAENVILTGWNFPFNINTNSVRSIVANGGTVTHADNYAIAQSGTDPDGAAEIRTESQLAYTPGVGAVARFTAVFSEPQEGAQQIIGVGDADNGLFFGFDGLLFGAMRRSGGVETWFYQTAWNVDTRPDFDYTKGNVFEIRFQWLGYGMQYFAMESATGAFSDVHRVDYANHFVATSLDVPSFPVSMKVTNGGTNTTNVTIQSPSAVAMSQGDAFPAAFTTPVGYSYLQAVSTGSNYLFTLRNPSTYFSKDNKLYLEPILLTLTNEVNKAVTFTVLFNTVLTTPTFTDIDADITPAQVDILAAAYTGGVEIMTFTVPAANGASFDMNSIFDGWRLWPDSAMTIIAEAGGSGDVTVGLTFRSRV